jgi:hypothetical protein
VFGSTSLAEVSVSRAHRVLDYCWGQRAVEERAITARQANDISRSDSDQPEKMSKNVLYVPFRVCCCSVHGVHSHRFLL